MTGGKATKHIVETIAKVIFLICAAVAIVAVLSITVYMFAKGTPALAKVGVIDLLFGTVWPPLQWNDSGYVKQPHPAWSQVDVKYKPED